MTIESLVAHYGLPGLGIAAGLEGEAMAVLGGFLAHRGYFVLWQAIAAVMLGAIVADQIWFQVGRRLKGSRVVRHARERPAFGKAMALLERHPIAFTFGFRFIYGLRTVSPIAIGTTGMRYATFLAVDLCAALVWSCLFVTLGFTFGHAIELLFGRIRALEHVLVAAAALILLVVVLVRIVRRRMIGKRDAAGD